MKRGIEAANAYLELLLNDEAITELRSIPREHPDFLKAWSLLTWFSSRLDIEEQRRLALEGEQLILEGNRDSDVIEATALCHFHSGDPRSAYELTVRNQNSIRWSRMGWYGLSTYSAGIVEWAEAAWLLMLCIRHGGDEHMFFDIDLLGLWEFAASSDVDIKTALAFAHPGFSDTLEARAGQSGEIDPSMRKILPARFHPHLRILRNRSFPEISPIAPEDVLKDFEKWKIGVSRNIERKARAAIKNSRNRVLEEQLAWALAAAKRGDTYAARWHAQFALAHHPDWLREFREKLSPLGLREVMDDLAIGLSRSEEFCKLLLKFGPTSGDKDLCGSKEIADLFQGTGYAHMIEIAEACEDGDDRARVAAQLRRMQLWPNDPTASFGLGSFFCSRKNWAAAEWILKRAPRSLTRLVPGKSLIRQVRDRKKDSDRPLQMNSPFYGQPDIGGLVKYGDCLRMTLGPMRRRAEEPALCPA